MVTINNKKCNAGYKTDSLCQKLPNMFTERYADDYSLNVKQGKFQVSVQQMIFKPEKKTGDFTLCEADGKRNGIKAEAQG